MIVAVFGFFSYKVVIAAVNLILLLLEFVDECMRDWCTIRLVVPTMSTCYHHALE